MYAINGWRPGPDKCWECYQPPIYYVISAAVLRSAAALADNSLLGWKAVQAIGTIASIATLFLTHNILRLWLPLSRAARNVALLALAILPQDLYASAFVGNDALLVFWTTAAIAGYSWWVRSDARWRGIILMAVGVIGAVWTKQSGAVALLLPGMVLAGGVLRWLNIPWLTFLRPISPAMAVVLFLCIPAAMADEIWRTSVTGKFLFSNQHVYDYTKTQAPGSVDLISFTSFRGVALWNSPVMGPTTLSSLWTELFARVWYDYEPRYLPEGTGLTWLARSLYVVGAVVTVFAMIGAAVFAFGSRRRLDGLAILLLFLAFLAVPVLQTARFPYFSSMKAIFVLPAVSIAALFLAFGLQQLPQSFRKPTFVTLAALLVLVGSAHVFAIVIMRETNIATSTVPLWSIPNVQ